MLYFCEVQKQLKLMVIEIRMVAAYECGDGDDRNILYLY